MPPIDPPSSPLPPLPTASTPGSVLGDAPAASTPGSVLGDAPTASTPGNVLGDAPNAATPGTPMPEVPGATVPGSPIPGGPAPTPGTSLGERVTALEGQLAAGGNVRYDEEQSLTEEQQRQARENIQAGFAGAIILSEADAPPIYPHTITIDGGPFTDGADPVEFPELHYDGLTLGRPAYRSEDGEYYLQWDSSGWILGQNMVAEWFNPEDVENPEAFESPFWPLGDATGEPSVQWSYLLNRAAARRFLISALSEMT